MKKSSILFVVILLIIITAVISIVYKKNDEENIFITGKLIGISYGYNKQLTVLIENNDTPTYYTFEKKEDLERKDIALTDTVEIRTDGIIRTSYPGQATAFDISLKEKANRTQIEYEDIPINNDYELNDEFDYRPFKTKMIMNKEELSAIYKSEIPELQEINLEEKAVLIVYNYMSSTPAIAISEVFLINEKIYINTNITSTGVDTDDLTLRGFYVIFDKNDIVDKSYEIVYEYQIIN